MKNVKKWAVVPVVLALLLLCAACTRGDPGEAVKEMRIEKSQAADGTLICAIEDQEGLEELGDILFAEYETEDAIDLPEGAQSLYFYTVYQTETLKAGQDPASLSMRQLLRYTVYEDTDCLTMEVLLPEAVNQVPFAGDLADLLTFTCQLAPEQADLLRTYGNE